MDLDNNAKFGYQKDDMNKNHLKRGESWVEIYIYIYIYII